MQLDGDIITIDLSMSLEDILNFEDFVRPRLEYIQRIEVEHGSVLKSSALLALLWSLKQSKQELNIPFLEQEKAIFSQSGTLHWIYVN